MADIAVLNNDGLVIGAKPRSAIAPGDLYHAVFVLLITPDKKLIASEMPGKKLSATAVTMCHHNETAAEAAARISPAILHHLGDQFYTDPQGNKQYVSVFYGTGRVGEGARDYKLLASKDISDGTHCTPALKFVWQSYRHLLPVA